MRRSAMATIPGVWNPFEKLWLASTFRSSLHYEDLAAGDPKDPAGTALVS